MSQSLANILLHFVFSTKNRELFIDSHIESQLYPFLITESVKKGNYVHSIGGVEDHIHMLIALHRSQSVSDLIGNLKKSSSRWIKTKGAKYCNFSWQNGYGVFSACSMDLEPL